MRVRTITAIAALLAMIAPTAAAAGGPGTAASEPRPPVFTPGSAGAGDPYFPLDGNGGYDVTHYDLAFRFDPATGKIDSVATISAVATQDLSSFDLDLNGLDVRSITVD